MRKHVPTAYEEARISAAILAERLKGRTMPEAMDVVLGTGAYTKFAGELYDRLRAKAAQGA